MKHVYFLSGGIAAGKSTVLSQLQKRYETHGNVAFVYEPVREWLEVAVGKSNLLGAMYDGDISKSTFQFSVIISRFRSLYKALVAPGIDTIFVERSPWDEKHVFAKTNLSTAEFQAYGYMFDSLMGFFEDFPALRVTFVYLQTEVDVLMERMNLVRKRSEENSVSREYMNSLDEAHSLMFSNFKVSKEVESTPNVKSVTYRSVQAGLSIELVVEEVVGIIKTDGVFVDDVSNISKYEGSLTRVDSSDAASMTHAEALAGPISERARAARTAMSKLASKEASPFASPFASPVPTVAPVHPSECVEQFIVLPDSLVSS